MIPTLTHPDDMVIQEGDDDKYFYLIADGKLNVLHKYFPQNPCSDKLKTLRKGGYFGEISILYDCKRSCSIKSLNYAILAKVDHHKFEKVNNNFKKHLKQKTL